MDPTNLSEGLFALANFLSISRICSFLPANELLGPLEITFEKMISVCYYYYLFKSLYSRF